MLALSLTGSLLGLVPPLALGFLIDALTGRGDRGAALWWALAVAAAVVAEAAAYVVSDGLYARVAARLYQDLRALMFDGLLRAGVEPEGHGAFASRFISDAETAEHLTVGLLDQGAVCVFDLGAALVALWVLDVRLVLAALVAIAAAAVAMRRLQRPASVAGERRQETLEEMSDALSAPTSRRFLAALRRVTAAERRLGWIGAANRHGNLAVAGLGPVVVLLVAGYSGGFRAGTLVSVYLLAGRAFAAVERLLDVTLDVELARGAVNRCFAIADGAPAGRASPPSSVTDPSGSMLDAAG
jgi:ABC-type multidrug transport system fused ATPase/permease subunit